MQNVIYEYCEVQNKELKQYIIDTPFLHNCGILNFEDKDYYQHQYTEIKKFGLSHDRFLLINEEVYHIDALETLSKLDVLEANNAD